MQFILNTKPLIDSLNLSVINANVTKYFQKSTLAQLTATDGQLRLNFEAASIMTEVVLSGNSDCDESATIFVDCLLLKQLISTIESPTVTLEFSESGLIIHSGKSKFTLPKVIDDDLGVDLARPETSIDGSEIELNSDNWKFVKDFQMYAIAMSLMYPVYTKVYIGQNSEVIVGDFDNSVFTYSNKNNLNRTCLLSSTIINLFNNLPAESKVYMLDDNSYIVHAGTDAYTFTAQFIPSFETDEGVGSYNAEAILDLMEPSVEYTGMVANVNDINKVLNQSALLSGSSEDCISIEISGDSLRLRSDNVDCYIPITIKHSENTEFDNYSVKFKTSTFKSVISNNPDDTMTMYPLISDGEVSGIRFKFNDMTVVLAGVES